MNVQEGAGLVHLTGEHTPELKLGDIGLQRMDIFFNSIQRFLIALLGRKLEQFAGILQRPAHFIQGKDYLFQTRPFPAQTLGTFRIIPDLRLFQFADDLRQSFILAIEVKDTP